MVFYFSTCYYTPLLLAVEKDSIEIVRLLLQRPGVNLKPKGISRLLYIYVISNPYLCLNGVENLIF